MNRLLAATTVALVVIGATSSSAYVAAGYRWTTFDVPFYVNPANSDVTPDVAEAAVLAGAGAWMSQTNAGINLYYGGRTTISVLSNDRKNVTFFRNTTGPGTIAETYAWYDSNGKLSDADTIYYDGGFLFVGSDAPCSGGMYIQDIATHEFGHVLGLAHSPLTDATMYYAIGYCSTEWRSLSPDDIAGIESLYPSTATNTAPVVTITAPISGTTEPGSTPVGFAGSATDTQDGDLSAGIGWRSSIDGQLGTGSSISATLSAGTHVITAAATDKNGATTTAQITITVASTTTQSTSATLVLSAAGKKVKGLQQVSLSWSGATSAQVDVYRDGIYVMTTANDGQETDKLNRKGSATYAYVVCESGTQFCSAPATVVF